MASQLSETHNFVIATAIGWQRSITDKIPDDLSITEWVLNDNKWCLILAISLVSLHSVSIFGAVVCNCSVQTHKM